MMQSDLFATSRSGKFSNHDHLRCDYVGLGNDDALSPPHR
jgi:hypothetical protein